MAALASRHERTIPCTMEWCQHRFGSEEDMKRHKDNDPQHFFCKKCDVDCEDWEDLTKHKVEMMRPFVEGGVKLRNGQMPKHIVCEFCGEDFKSFGGRKRHRSQYHPAEQDVRCPGCASIFVRAGDMVGHLENGRCEIISRREFLLRMQQKFINAQIMKNPEAFTESLGNNGVPPSEMPRLTGRRNPLMITGEDDSLEEVEEGEDAGGVSVILDQPNAETGGYKAMEPEVNTMPLTRANLETWPCLSSTKSSQRSSSTVSHLDKTLGGMSIASSGSDDEIASQSTIIVETAITSPTVWNENTSKALFSMAKPSARAGDWAQIQRAREEAANISESSNVLRSHWWDPASPDYKVDVFFNQMIGRYCCPFPACVDDGQSYLAPSDLEDHIHLVHLRGRFSCPVCFKIFKSCASLIRHAESTQKCGVRSSAGFKQLIEDISGGYLKAKYIGEHKIYERGETALVKKGEPMSGVMSTQYIGKKPEE